MRTNRLFAALFFTLSFFTIFRIAQITNNIFINNSNRQNNKKPQNIEYFPIKSKIIRNVPEYLWDKNNKNPKFFNKTCAFIPKFRDIKFSNLYWQVWLSKVMIYIRTLILKLYF